MGGVGVDFVFPCHNKKNKNQNITSTRRKNPSCLMSDIWRLSDRFKGCLLSVLEVSGGYLLSIWRAFERCLLGGSGRCLKETGQVKLGQGKLENVKGNSTTRKVESAIL